MGDTPSYPIQVTIPVAWNDMDAFGHVNNVVYFRWFESARIAYFEQMGLNDLKEQSGVGPILAHTSCQFRVPLDYPDTIRAMACIKSMGRTSFVMEYAVESERMGLAAIGEGVVVMIDYRTGNKVPIPAELRKHVEQIENRTF